MVLEIGVKKLCPMNKHFRPDAPVMAERRRAIESLITMSACGGRARVAGLLSVVA